MKFAVKAAVAAAILCLPAVGSAQYTVYVGYADGLRGAPTFPSPWFGDALVQFFSGFAGPGGADAGAIMIHNDGAAPISLEGLVYTLASPCTDGGPDGNNFSCSSDVIKYDFSWAFTGGPLVLGVDRYAIFTGQNGIGDFDSSDYGVGAGVFFSRGGCSDANPNAPHLDVTVGGSGSGFNDTGKILDTDGVDEAVCDNFHRGGNEALGWRPIGTTGTVDPNNHVAPEPSTIVLTASGLIAVAGFVRRRRAIAA